MKDITNVIIGKNGTGTAESVYQYNYGITLRINNVQLPTAVEVQFSLHDTRGESITRIGLTRDGVTDVIVPDSMLENGDAAEDYIIFAWVYIRNEKTGTTEYKITIPVCARAKPEAFDRPEEAELFRAAIDAVNESARRAETAGTEARSWAIGGTGSREGEDTDNARYYAQQALESAGTASEKEQAVRAAEEAVDKLHSEVVKLGDATSKNAENAAQSAAAAENSAAAASASEQAAIGAAGRAERSESAAVESEKTATAAAASAEESASAASSAQQRAEADQAAAAKSAEAAALSERDAAASEKAATQAAQAAAESEKAAGASAAAAGTSEKAATAAAQQTAADRQATETASAAAQQAATTAAEAQQSIQAAAEQIETNKAGIESLKEDLAAEITRATSAEDKKADKTALELTDRRLNALWKLSEGVSYQFETDAATAYQKDVPSGAKMANIKNVGGKTIVWNQYSKILSEETGWAYRPLDRSYYTALAGHVVYIKYKTIVKEITKQVDLYSRQFLVIGDDKAIYFGNENIKKDDLVIGRTVETKKIITMPKVITGIYAYNYGDNANATTATCDTWINIFDLTKMFGAGNEPSTVEEFEAMFPADYYPYNEGELISAPVNEVVEQGNNTFDPQTLAAAYPDNICVEDDIIKIFKPSNLLYSAGIEVNIPEGYSICLKPLQIQNMSTNARLRIVYEDGSTKEIYLSDDSGSIKNTQTFSIKKRVSYLRFNWTTVNNGFAFRIQVEHSSEATDYSPYHNASYLIPSEILNLPGYGWSVKDVCNEIDFENKKYIQRVGNIAIDANSEIFKNDKSDDNWLYFIRTKNNAINVNNIMSNVFLPKERIPTYNYETGSCAISNSYGVIYFNLYNLIKENKANIAKQWLIDNNVKFYYPLPEPVVIDISDILTDDLTAIPVEAGGTLTFKNSNGDGFQIPVSNEVEYAVKLSEVASND